jgi:hypothetical protein
MRFLHCEHHAFQIELPCSLLFALFEKLQSLWQKNYSNHVLKNQNLQYNKAAWQYEIAFVQMFCNCNVLKATYYICLSNNDLTGVLSWFVKQHQYIYGSLR